MDVAMGMVFVPHAAGLSDSLLAVLLSPIPLFYYTNDSECWDQVIAGLCKPSRSRQASGF